jgi:hypothetical protein
MIFRTILLLVQNKHAPDNITQIIHKYGKFYEIFKAIISIWKISEKVKLAIIQNIYLTILTKQKYGQRL